MNDDSRMVKDPICGKDVDTLRARAVGIFGGVTYYFCSQECKSKFKDPRGTVGGEPPVPDRRKVTAAEKKAAVAEKAKMLDKLQAAAENESEEPVRYARSRLRRITGGQIAPVVQIDLSPSKENPAATGEQPAPDQSDPNDPLDSPARSSRAWALVAIVMLIIAGGVILFTLKGR